LIATLAMVGCSGDRSTSRNPSTDCGSQGAQLTTNGRTFCAPTPSNDLRRFSAAASLAAFLNRPYADVVNDLVRIADPSGAGHPKQSAPGTLKLESDSQIAVADVVAPKGEAISLLTLKNQGQQPTRALIDCGRVHLDVMLAPGQEVNTGNFLANEQASVATILIAGTGSKTITGTTQVVKAGGANDCVLFERTFSCNFCSGSRCRGGTGGEESSGECVTKTPQRCFLIFDEPASCECK